MTNAIEKLAPNEKKEAESYIEAGMKLVTLAQFNRDIKPMGFKLDRSMDCHGIARCLSSGRSYRSITSCARQIKTGKGFANIDCERDSSWREFMEYRKNHFAILRGAIFTV